MSPVLEMLDSPERTASSSGLSVLTSTEGANVVEVKVREVHIMGRASSTALAIRIRSSYLEIVGTLGDTHFIHMK